MNRSFAGRLVWLWCGLVLLLTGATVILIHLNQRSFWDFFFQLGVISAVLVGGLVAWRQAANPIGWLICAAAFCFTLGEFSRQYAIYGLLTQPGALPLARLMASPPYWIWYPAVIMMFVLAPLYFPNGRLVSPRWRPVVWITLIAAALMVGVAATEAGDFETPGIPNPLGMHQWSAAGSGVPGSLFIIIMASWVPLSAAAAGSVVVRLRRAAGEERQQLKWFAFAVTLLAAYSILRRLYLHLVGPLPFFVDNIFSVVIVQGIWLAIAVAVLRYRLYEIDVIIRRTLLYSGLTVILTVVYFGSVVVLQSVLAAASGDPSSAAIVVSTLTIAALFSPLRRRLQEIIDRRFYRRKYDATQALAAFAATARGEVDLKQLTTELVMVIADTMQPAHVSLWLKEASE